jgi:hypothetical protein
MAYQDKTGPHSLPHSRNSFRIFRRVVKVKLQRSRGFRAFLIQMISSSAQPAARLAG